jgi:hypothetical protein
LIYASKALPKGRLQQLKAEIEKESRNDKSKIDLEILLLNGPTATKDELKTIEIRAKENAMDSIINRVHCENRLRLLR